MTEEIEAHVLKKYEILQKLGKLFRLNTHEFFGYPSLQFGLFVLNQEHPNRGFFFTFFAKNIIYHSANADFDSDFYAYSIYSEAIQIKNGSF